MSSTRKPAVRRASDGPTTRGKGKEPTTRTVDASPTKGLFIEMLVRDIELMHAIVDLVDNAVDGARRVRSEKRPAKGKKEFAGFFLDVVVSEMSVTLHDNCGGISVSDAEDYAFKFGRPSNVKGVESSIGQFGVGMKRAFFKLGETIDLDSVTSRSRFSLHLEVPEWRNQPKWQFELHAVAEDTKQPTKDIGTRVEITDLLPGVAEEIGASSFPHELLDELTLRHRDALNQGFKLSVNDIQAQPTWFELLWSSDIVPSYEEFTHENGGDPVRVRIACGVAESQPGTAGWDVVCNGRMVLKSDQTPTTGWRAGGETFIPSYHNQFARFRGLVSFDSTDASRVPWTTTKTGLDQDSSVWREAKQRMILHMRPVIDFLNALDREKDLEAADTTGTTLSAAVEEAEPTPLEDLPYNKTFKYPKTSKAPKAGRISYTRPKALIEEAKKFLGVSTGREVGEETFDYWVASELDEDED